MEIMQKNTFKVGDEVIWLKPVKMKITEEFGDIVRAKVLGECVYSYSGEEWNFCKNSGLFAGGVLESHGMLIQPEKK